MQERADGHAASEAAAGPRRPPPDTALLIHPQDMEGQTSQDSSHPTCSGSPGGPTEEEEVNHFTQRLLRKQRLPNPEDHHGHCWVF